MKKLYANQVTVHKSNPKVVRILIIHLGMYLLRTVSLSVLEDHLLEKLTRFYWILEFQERPRKVKE